MGTNYTKTSEGQLIYIGDILVTYDDKEYQVLELQEDSAICALAEEDLSSTRIRYNHIKSIIPTGQMIDKLQNLFEEKKEAENRYLKYVTREDVRDFYESIGENGDTIAKRMSAIKNALIKELLPFLKGEE